MANPIGYKPEEIVAREKRIDNYFPDKKLQSIITGGLSRKFRDLTNEEMTLEDAKGITNREVLYSLEGSWIYNLFEFVTNPANAEDPSTKTAFSDFIDAARKIETLPQDKFGKKWKVDSAANDWAPIWVRLIDKTKECLAKHPELQQVMSAQDVQKLDDAYTAYKAYICGPSRKDQGIDARRIKHGEEDREFAIIVAPEKFRNLEKALRSPTTLEFTSKHAGEFLLIDRDDVVQIQDHETRMAFVKLYFEALSDAQKAHPELKLTKKLIEKFEGHLEKFPKEFTGTLNPEIEALYKATFVSGR